MQKKTLSLGKVMLATVATISLITLYWQTARPRTEYWPTARPRTQALVVPDELIGEWHTSNANYSDRSFEIDPVSISFGTGGGTVTTGFIRKVSAVQQGARTLYTISYQTNESVNEVCLYYETAKGKVIHFRNQESIDWTKD